MSGVAGELNYRGTQTKVMRSQLHVNKISRAALCEKPWRRKMKACAQAFRDCAEARELKGKHSGSQALFRVNSIVLNLFYSPYTYSISGGVTLTVTNQ